MRQAIGLRFFVLANDNLLYALSKTTLDKITSASQPLPLPEYSDQELKVVQVSVEHRGRDPSRIVDVLCSTLPFDKRGTLDFHTYLGRASEAFKSLVFGAAPFTRRRRSAKSWSPTRKQSAELRAAALGERRLPYFRVGA